MKTPTTTAAVLALALFAAQGQAQCEIQAFAPSDGAPSSGFGVVLDVDGNWLVVGSPRDDDEGNDSGSAYLFERLPSGWTEVQRIVPTQHAAGDRFGTSVAVSGTTVLVGARLQDTSKGAAFVFDHDGVQWLETQRLQPMDLVPGAEFGWTLALDGDRAIVGAPTSNSQTPGTGEVYEFTRTGGTWTQTEKLTTNDPNLEFFGRNLVLDGSRMLIGAAQLSGTPSGTVFVFEDQNGTWQPTATLAPALERNVFPLDLDGDTALLGDPFTDFTGPNSGAAWLFQFDGATWTETDLLQPPGITALGYFGSAGCVDEQHVAVGAPSDDVAGLLAGTFFTFERGTSGLSAGTKVYSGPPIPGENIGTALAFSGGTLLSGSGQSQGIGKIHVFDLEDATVPYCTAKVDSAGCLPQIESTGVPSLTAPGFEIAIPSALNSKFGVLFYGQGPAAAPFFGGTLCVQPPLARTTPQFSAGTPPGQGPDCTGTFAFTMSPEIQSSPLFSAGDVGYAQYWYRDPFGSFGVGLSNALAFDICP